MKILVKIDFFAQLLLLAVALCFALMMPFNMGYFGIVMLAQFCIGCLQYLSSLVAVILKTDLWNKKRIHLILSTLYLTILFAGMEIQIHGIPAAVLMTYVFIVPWALALYYFILTWKLTFASKSSNGGFLPHTSF
jgi:hypothetical protein